MRPTERLPSLVLSLFAVGLTLALLYLAVRLLEIPSSALRAWTDLDGEGSLATWFSTLQLALPAALLTPLIVTDFARGERHAWALLLLALVFLALSADEAIEIHERLGRLSDGVLPEDDRRATFFRATGIWMFVLGVPFIVALGLLLNTLRRGFRRVPGVLTKLLLGAGLWLGGALGVELLDNLVQEEESALGLAQIFLEEAAEMLGVTLMVWAFVQLLVGRGFRWQLAEANGAGTRP